MSKIASKPETENKCQYKILNWPEYNKSLIKRGDITIWIEEGAVNNWYHEGPNQRGAQYYYSDGCIVCLLGLKAVFGLAYRQTEGFASSILQVMGYGVEVPSYTQINRRAKEVEMDISLPRTKSPLHLVFDSTGLKIYGEGEWKVRKHGYSKRRTWRKLHLGVDEETGFIYAQVLTENGVDDASQLQPMLEQVEEDVVMVGADGAYDKKKCWDYLKGEFIEAIIPPREDAVYWTDGEGGLLDIGRNSVLKKIDKMGMKKWKEKSGYHRRSLSETAMYRFKTIFGAKLFSRELSRQKTEAKIKIKVLNKMTAIGMPISIAMA